MCVWIVPELNVREVTRVMCDTNYKRERCTWVVQNDNASVRHLASSGDLTPDVPADPQSATPLPFMSVSAADYHTKTLTFVDSY